ncbi:MAG: response regulator [Candidatus Omnitrophica bacterium]|nr:response regulator [Candidatus Omnitrophota bacterium]
MQMASVTPAKTLKKVVIVNGTSEVLELLESVLEPGHYDVVFLEQNARAYSQIRRVKPNLVILCVRIEDLDGFQVLSMLKLDEETSDIPVLTYTTEYEGQQIQSYLSERNEEEQSLAKAALSRN